MRYDHYVASPAASRVGACPVTTDCIVAMSSCENNNNVPYVYEYTYLV